jgi:hypothetical protein
MMTVIVCGISAAAPRPCTAPGGDELGRILRQAAQHRRHREQRNAPDEHRARPAHITQPAGDDQQRGEDEDVDIDHPQHLVQRRVQLGDHAGDGDVDDRDVQQRHEESQAERQ